MAIIPARPSAPIVDPLYFMDSISKTYIPLTEDIYKKIIDRVQIVTVTFWFSTIVVNLL